MLNNEQGTQCIQPPYHNHPPEHHQQTFHNKSKHISQNLMHQVATATLFPRPLSRVTEPAGHIAVVLMNLFFSVRVENSNVYVYICVYKYPYMIYMYLCIYISICVYMCIHNIAVVLMNLFFSVC